jgi:hypothetical protein
MTRLEAILCGVILVLMVLFLRTCTNTPVLEQELTPKIEYVNGKSDTLYFTDTVYRVPKIMPSKIIETKVDTDEISGKAYTSFVYQTSFEDSLIKGVITSSVKGKLLSEPIISYKPKFPRFITRVDTFRIKEPVPVVKQKWGLYIGGVVGGNLTSFNVQPAILIKTNRSLQLTLGYGIIDKSYNIGIFTKINNPLSK